MKKTNVLLLSNSGDSNSIDWIQVGKKFKVSNLKVYYEQIKKLSDPSNTKSDKKKIRQDITLKLVNKYFDTEKFKTYAELENFLKLSPDLRAYVRILRDALQGMSNMMEPYVLQTITFESWAAIVKSRELIRNHSRAKAKAIEAAAKTFRAEQQVWAENTRVVMDTVSMEGKIDALTAESLPDDTKMQISRLTGDSHAIAQKTKEKLNSFKAEQLKAYENSPSTYNLPEAK